jgi:hypothetical protein
VADKPSPIQRTTRYIEATCSDDALTLIKHYPPAWTLATVMGMRARYKEDQFNPHALDYRESFLGDYENYGLSEREYRTAKTTLETGGFATFRATNKGTIGKLIDTRLFRINLIAGDGQNDGQRAKPATNKPTTNLEVRSSEVRNTDKAYSTKARKLSSEQKEIADRFESALGNEWVNDAGKWINRIKDRKTTEKCDRVIAEVESGVKEGRIQTTPARFAEDTWKRFR